MQDQKNDDGLGGRSRDRREFAEDNQRWARRLMALPEEALARLTLPHPLPEEVALSRKLDDGRARNRSLRRVDMLVSGLTPAEVAAIDAFLADPPLDADDPRIERWFTRLLDGGDDAISAFSDAHPAVELQPLRTLLRNARKPSLATRARRQLRELLMTLPEVDPHAG